MTAGLPPFVPTSTNDIPNRMLDELLTTVVGTQGVTPQFSGRQDAWEWALGQVRLALGTKGTTTPGATPYGKAEIAKNLFNVSRELMFDGNQVDEPLARELRHLAMAIDTLAAGVDGCREWHELYEDFLATFTSRPMPPEVTEEEIALAAQNTVSTLKMMAERTVAEDQNQAKADVLQDVLNNIGGPHSVPTITFVSFDQDGQMHQFELNREDEDQPEEADEQVESALSYRERAELRFTTADEGDTFELTPFLTATRTYQGWKLTTRRFEPRWFRKDKMVETSIAVSEAHLEALGRTNRV